MKKLGIILAAGKSTRLYPVTLTTTKQLLPVYDKPLIYYPLTTLMLAGIRDFIIIVSSNEKQNFEQLFSNSEEELGICVRVLVQPQPNGIAEAFLIIAKHIDKQELEQYDSHVLILGDNIFYGSALGGMLKQTLQDTTTAHIFLYPNKTPEKFGVAELIDGKINSLEEKPKQPKSNLIVTGLYAYPSTVYDYVSFLVPSERNELEITDLNKYYLQQNQLHATQLLRGMIWFDTGNADTLLEASNFIRSVQSHQNYLVGSPHEIAIMNKWATNIKPFIKLCSKTPYGIYLDKLLTNTV